MALSDVQLTLNEALPKALMFEWCWQQPRALGGSLSAFFIVLECHECAFDDV